MAPPRKVVVVGSSVGGVRTAQALRSGGFAGRIELVGEETDLPYDKPPLSKQFLAGSWDTARLSLLSVEAARAADIELRLGTAAQHLDVSARQVILADGSTISYDVVVLATGAAARPSPWTVASGVHVLRTLSDSRALREDLATEGPVVVVGGGFIGAEVAATARGLGRQVTVVDPLPSPIGRAVGSEVGELLTDLHHRHGVATRFGTGVECVTGRAGELTVRLADGSELAAGTVVVGIGATPNDGWLEASDLAVDNGVICDQYCRSVTSPEVYAVGDLARWFHPGHGEYTRVEHWTNAVDSATVVAHNIAHPDELKAYAPVEYVWSDQYDWTVQIVGRPATARRCELVGDLGGEKARGAVLYADDSGRLTGAVAVNWPKALATSRRLLSAHASFADALAAISKLPRPV